MLSLKKIVIEWISVCKMIYFGLDTNKCIKKNILLMKNQI